MIIVAISVDSCNSGYSSIFSAILAKKTCNQNCSHMFLYIYKEKYTGLVNSSSDSCVLSNVLRQNWFVALDSVSVSVVVGPGISVDGFPFKRDGRADFTIS